MRPKKKPTPKKIMQRPIMDIVSISQRFLDWLAFVIRLHALWIRNLKIFFPLSLTLLERFRWKNHDLVAGALPDRAVRLGLKTHPEDKFIHHKSSSPSSEEGFIFGGAGSTLSRRS